jgi:hypothetical protein
LSQTQEQIEVGDKLLLNTLATICLNSNVRTDIMHFLRLIIRNKSEGQIYEMRNKLINALAFLLELACKKDHESLMMFFELDLDKKQQDKLKISDHQWNRIFLIIVGVLRVLLANNKKLIMHLVNCMVLKDQHFSGKGDQLL